MKRYILTALFLSIFLTFPGCAPKKVTVPFKGYSLPPEDVLKKISRTDNPKDTLKAIARITTNTSKGRHSIKIAVVARRPSFFRAEAMPVIGTSGFFLSVSGDSLRAFLPAKGEFYIGQATMKNIARVFPIDLNLKVEDMVSILTGTPPRVKGENITLQGYAEGELYRIDIISGSKKVQSLWVDPSHDSLVRIETSDNDGSILYRARLEDHSRIDGMSFPGRVIIMAGKTGKSSVSIRYSDVHLSQDVDTALFDLDIPAGIKLIYID